MNAIEERFILHWGEMAARWGLNRTVAQIHALLYLAPEPLAADALCERLGVARSNVSNSLRELQNWGVVRVVHVLGDRRDHFETITDVWELFRRVIEERKRREIDPTLEFLRQSVREAEAAGAAAAHTRARMEAMRDFFETLCRRYDEVRALPVERLIQLLSVGDMVTRIFRPRGGGRGAKDEPARGRGAARKGGAP